MAEPTAVRKARLDDNRARLRARVQQLRGQVDHDREQGVWANSDTKRSTARANFQFYPTDRVNYAVSFSYGRTDTRFPMGDNGTNALESAWTFRPGAALARALARRGRS